MQLWRVVDERLVADNSTLHRILRFDSLALIIDADVDDVVLVVEPEVEEIW